MRDDLERSIERLLEGSPASRRAFMRRVGTTGFALTGASAFLAACGGIEGEGGKGGDGGKAVATPEAVSHPKTKLTAVTISNWPLYIDKKVVKDFGRKYDVDIKYIEEINDLEEYFGKVRPSLAAGRDTGRDLMVLTDWMAARMIRLGYLEPLDKNNIPNIKNLVPALQSPQWDPERNYSLPWQSGMTAIGYNPQKTGREIKSYKDMFDPAFKGRVTMLSDARDASNLILMRDGKKPEDATLDDVLGAIEEIDKANRAGQFRRFTGNDYSTDLTNGNVWIAQAYSGDLVQLQADNPHLKFVVPEEGGTLWTDNMLMPKNLQHPYAAEVWMNYVYDPVVAAKIAAWVNYFPPVVGAKEELAKTDPKTAENELIFPSDETLANLHPYVNLDDDDARKMNEAMQAVVGA